MLPLTQEELEQTPDIYLPQIVHGEYMDGTNMPFGQRMINARIRLLIQDGVELPFDISYDELHEVWKLRDAAPKSQKNAALIEAIKSLL